MNSNQNRIAGNLSSQMSGVRNPKDDVGEPNPESAAAVQAGANQSGWQPEQWKKNLAAAFSSDPEPKPAPALTDWQKQVQSKLVSSSTPSQ